MKSLLLTAALLGFAIPVNAADPAPAPSPGKTTTVPATPGTKKADTPTPESKAMPMNHKVDTIDAAAKTFTYTTKKGVKVVHHITDKTEIQQDGKPAQFSDIKPGDTVSGLHLKKSDTEYEVVKITKFGPAAEKEKKAEKEETETKKAPAPKK